LDWTSALVRLPSNDCTPIRSDPASASELKAAGMWMQKSYSVTPARSVIVSVDPVGW
jgi:hypothetical protein